MVVSQSFPVQQASPLQSAEVFRTREDRADDVTEGFPFNDVEVVGVVVGFSVSVVCSTSGEGSELLVVTSV